MWGSVLVVFPSRGVRRRLMTLGVTATLLASTFTVSAGSSSAMADSQVSTRVSTAAKKWMTPRVQSVEVVRTGYLSLVDVNIRSAKKLQKKKYAYIEVRGGGSVCLITTITRKSSCSLRLSEGTKRVKVKVRANINGDWKPWSKARKFTFDLAEPEPLPDPEPTPTPPAAPTGFISIHVIGPPWSCNNPSEPGGLRIPLQSQGPGDLPTVLVELSTRREVATGTYTLTPGDFSCDGIRYAPSESPVRVTVPRSITGHAYLFYEAATSPNPPPTNGANDAASVLASLPVRSEVRTGYDRDLFRHWVDADGDGCDTREEVLLEESLTPTQTTTGCRVTSGSWSSAFDGVTTRDPSSFDVDHMVPLAEAWDSGAREWSAATRQAFANDLGYAGSLIAVSASSNRSKGDRDPAEWLPPSISYRCTYVTTWIAVKYRWSLSVDPVERTALQSAVTSCGNPTVSLPPKARTGQG